ncbi:hypothetical protein [Vibrio cholerae]|uniref:hypothetical protein n=1 Tax=Vibrio cholerae TaxID=666 RepID=UPI00384AD976
MIQVKNGNLEKASSSYAFKLGKNELAKIIIGIKNVRDEKKLKQLQDRKSELLSESAKNNVTKILLVKRSIEKNEGKTKKRERRLNQYGFKTVPSSIPETISKSESFDKSQYEFLGKGSRGNVYRDGNNVIKEVNGASCSGQLKLATFLAFTQYRRSDSLGVRPPLYQCGLRWL